MPHTDVHEKRYAYNAEVQNLEYRCGMCKIPGIVQYFVQNKIMT